MASSRFVVSALIVLVLSTAVGCSDPCISSCEELKTCPDADQTVDCEDSCAVSTELAELFECQDILDVATQCEADAEDICTAHETCAPYIAAYTACTEARCEQEPSLCGD